MVGCEACHGPGARHVDAAQRFVLANPGEEAKIEQEMRATIVKTPPDTVCAACHKVQAHQKHPAYDGPSSSKDKSTPVVVCDPALSIAPRLTSTARMPSSSRYSTKTCGGCHYVQYKQWSTEKHSALSWMLPAKYLNDQSCQNCHPNANAGASSASIERRSAQQLDRRRLRVLSRTGARTRAFQPAVHRQPAAQSEIGAGGSGCNSQRKTRQYLRSMPRSQWS